MFKQEMFWSGNVMRLGLAYISAATVARTPAVNCTKRFNVLTPNVNYSGRTAPLTSKVAFYIFIQQI